MRVSNEMDELSRNSERFLVNNANLFPDASPVFSPLSLDYFSSLVFNMSFSFIRQTVMDEYPRGWIGKKQQSETCVCVCSAIIENES